VVGIHQTSQGLRSWRFSFFSSYDVLPILGVGRTRSPLPPRLLSFPRSTSPLRVRGSGSPGAPRWDSGVVGLSVLIFY